MTLEERLKQLNQGSFRSVVCQLSEPRKDQFILLGVNENTRPMPENACMVLQDDPPGVAFYYDLPLYEKVRRLWHLRQDLIDLQLLMLEPKFRQAPEHALHADGGAGTRASTRTESPPRSQSTRARTTVPSWLLSSSPALTTGRAWVESTASPEASNDSGPDVDPWIAKMADQVKGESFGRTELRDSGIFPRRERNKSAFDRVLGEAVERNFLVPIPEKGKQVRYRIHEAVLDRLASSSTRPPTQALVLSHDEFMCMLDAVSHMCAEAAKKRGKGDGKGFNRPGVYETLLKIGARLLPDGEFNIRKLARTPEDTAVFDGVTHTMGAGIERFAASDERKAKMQRLHNLSMGL